MGIVRVDPGAHTDAMKAKAIKEGKEHKNDYAHACFNGIMNPDAKTREHNKSPCNLFDVLIGGVFAARLAKRNEFTGIQRAMDAYWAEWKNLESGEVWKWSELIIGTPSERRRWQKGKKLTLVFSSES